MKYNADKAMVITLLKERKKHLEEQLIDVEVTIKIIKRKTSNKKSARLS